MRKALGSIPSVSIGQWLSEQREALAFRADEKQQMAARNQPVSRPDAKANGKVEKYKKTNRARGKLTLSQAPGDKKPMSLTKPSQNHSKTILQQYRNHSKTIAKH